MKKERLFDIDQAKGFAIFLVVLGHITLSSQPQNVSWYEFIRVAIYKFHMPFFMYLSGYIMYYTLPKFSSILEYWTFTKQKAFRLIIPLIIFGLAIGIGKYTFQNFIKVDGVPQFSLFEFFKIILEPTNSFASSVWYIYVLFLFYLMVPLLIVLFNKREYLIVILGLIIHFIRPTNYFALNSFNEYLLYFSLGMISLKYRARLNYYFDKWRIFLIITFLFSFFLIFQNINASVSKLIISLISIPALTSLVRNKFIMENKSLTLYSKYTFVIYLLNTILIGLCKGIILKFFSWDGYNFILVAPILLLIGLYGPIVIKKYLFVRIFYLDKMTN